jgi:hypothetical protein
VRLKRRCRVTAINQDPFIMSYESQLDRRFVDLARDGNRHRLLRRESCHDTERRIGLLRLQSDSNNARQMRLTFPRPGGHQLRVTFGPNRRLHRCPSIGPALLHELASCIACVLNNAIELP